MQILDSVVDGALKLPDERDRKDYIYAAVVYLATGGVPAGIRPVADAMITSVLPALDNSRARAEAGRAGGSRRPSKREANAKQNGKQSYKQSGSGGVSDMCEYDEANEQAKGQANGKGRGRGIGRGIEHTTESVVCSERDPAQGQGPDPLGEPYRGPAAPPPMAAPSPADVAAYVAAQGAYPIDAERFCGHYASVGWRDKQGRPYADWRPLALMWSRGDRDRRAAEEREGAGRDDFSDLDRGV